MHRIIVSLKERKQDYKYLQDQKSISQEEIGKIKKNEKKRIKEENQYFKLLYQFSRLSQDENRVHFYQFSIELLDLKLDDSQKNKKIFDDLAQMYINFFEKINQKEKVFKIKVILDNNMHKNYSFLLILLKWVVEYYKNTLQQIINQLDNSFRIPMIAQKSLISDKNKFQFTNKKVPNLHLELNKLTISDNIYQSNSLDLRNRNKQKNQDQLKKNSFYPSIHREMNQQKANTMSTIREKNKSIDYDDRNKKLNHRKMRETYKEVIGDVDWEWVRIQDKNTIGQIHQRNYAIQKGIMENEQYMSQRKQNHNS